MQIEVKLTMSNPKICNPLYIMVRFVVFSKLSFSKANCLSVIIDKREVLLFEDIFMAGMGQYWILISRY